MKVLDFGLEKIRSMARRRSSHPTATACSTGRDWGASSLFARSLDGDITRNPWEQLVPGCVMPLGLVPTARGVYYVACDEQQQPVTLRYFEFASRRSFGLGPAPLGVQPILTVSPDGRRLVYSTSLPDNGELTRVTFRLTGR